MSPACGMAARNAPHAASSDHPRPSGCGIRADSIRCRAGPRAVRTLVQCLVWRRSYTALLMPLPGAARMAGRDATRLEKVRSGRGFFAALDQSGGSTPKALAEYGIDESRYTSEEEMFDLVHAMRTRVITDPAFDRSRILAAILFEQTMERDIQGVPTAQY